MSIWFNLVPSREPPTLRIMQSSEPQISSPSEDRLTSILREKWFWFSIYVLSMHIGFFVVQKVWQLKEPRNLPFLHSSLPYLYFILPFCSLLLPGSIKIKLRALFFVSLFMFILHLGDPVSGVIVMVEMLGGISVVWTDLIPGLKTFFTRLGYFANLNYSSLNIVRLVLFVPFLLLPLFAKKIPQKALWIIFLCFLFVVVLSVRGCIAQGRPEVNW